jgi:hypothetical protein
MNPVTAFFQSPACAWEFSLGGLLSFVPVRWSTAHETRSLLHGRVPVRLIRDTLHADYDVTLCLAQLAWNGRAACPPLIRANALSSDIYQAEPRAAANIPNVRTIDMSDAICKIVEILAWYHHRVASR